MKYPLFCGAWSRPINSGVGFGDAYFMWFRFFGYGLSIRWVMPGYIPLFSERMGIEKPLKLGRLWIRAVKP